MVGQLFDNIAGAMNGAPEEIIRRQLGHFHKADPAYAAGVAKALDLEYDASKAPESALTMVGASGRGWTPVSGQDSAARPAQM